MNVVCDRKINDGVWSVSNLSYNWLFQFHVGGFGGNIGHDPHILYTLSAVQVLALLDKIEILDIDKISSCIHPMIYLFHDIVKFHSHFFSTKHF